MRKPRIVSVVGARPQFIKASAVSKELRKKFEEILVHTGQHYDADMSDVFFEELGIPAPDCTLGVGSKSHARQTGEMMEKLEEFLLAQRPDFVFVYGDTNSTLAGVLSAAKLNLPVAHVEAGLRSFDMSLPEEVNRVIADRLSAILFAPTRTAVRNLSGEGIVDGVHLVGDVMVDALKAHIDIAGSRSTVLQNLGLRPGEYITATVHRASNTDVRDNLSNIVEILSASSKRVVFPMHPRTRLALRGFGLEKKLTETGSVLAISPLGYLDMLFLEKNSDAILTDSGGVQKEAYLLGVRCITLREETEWVETVEDGWNKLVGVDVNKALEAIKTFGPTSPRSDRFGKGDASPKIASILEEYFEGKIL